MTEIFPTIHQLHEAFSEPHLSVCSYLIKHPSGAICIGPSSLSGITQQARFIIPSPDYTIDSFPRAEYTDVQVLLFNMARFEACLLYTHDGKNYLFTHNLFCNSYGNWQVRTEAVLNSRHDVVETLALLREIPVDVLITNGSVYYSKYEELTPKTWQSIINSCIQRLKLGYYQ